MKIITLPPLPESLWRNGVQIDEYLWDDIAMERYGEQCMAVAYESAIEDACSMLRKLGEESKSLKLVFDAIATELKERLK